MSENTNELNINDLAVMRSIIEISTKRGAFEAGELAPIGAVYTKLDTFLKAVEAQQKAAKESEEELNKDSSANE